MMVALTLPPVNSASPPGLPPVSLHTTSDGVLLVHPPRSLSNVVCTTTTSFLASAAPERLRRAAKDTKATALRFMASHPLDQDSTLEDRKKSHNGAVISG